MKKQVSGGVGGTFLALGLGAVTALVASILFLLPCAFLVSGGKASEDMMPILTMAACFLGTLIGALVAWRRVRARALLIGAGEGIIAFLLLFALGLCFSSEPPVGAQVLSIFLSALLGGILGGALRLIKKKRRK